MLQNNHLLSHRLHAQRYIKEVYLLLNSCTYEAFAFTAAAAIVEAVLCCVPVLSVWLRNGAHSSYIKLGNFFVCRRF